MNQFVNFNDVYEDAKNHECSFFKRNDCPAFFVFFGSFFAGRLMPECQKIFFLLK